MNPESKPSEAVQSGDRAVERLKKQGETVREDLRDLGRIAKEAGAEKLDGAKQVATHYYDRGTRRAHDMENQVADYVRQYPLRSLGIAAGLGLLFGIVMRRR